MSDRTRVLHDWRRVGVMLALHPFAWLLSIEHDRVDGALHVDIGPVTLTIGLPSYAR